LDAAKRLAQFAPALKKYRRRKRFTPHEKAAIAHKEKLLRYTDHLIPLTKKQYRELKDQAFIPTRYFTERQREKFRTGEKKEPVPYKNNQGIFAIQLRNTSEHARIKKVKNDMIVTSNGRTFLYWKLPIHQPRNPKKTEKEDEQINKRSQKLLKEAAKKAFENVTGAFPIEQIAELAKRAFKSVKTKQVFLWAESGRVGEGFHNFDEFVQWLWESYSQYRNVERWVNGIAIQI
jgi:hypothetical protein